MQLKYIDNLQSSIFSLENVLTHLCCILSLCEMLEIPGIQNKVFFTSVEKKLIPIKSHSRIWHSTIHREDWMHTEWLLQRISNVEMRKKELEKFCRFLVCNTRVVTKNSDEQTQMKFNKVEKVWAKCLFFLHYCESTLARLVTVIYRLQGIEEGIVGIKFSWQQVYLSIFCFAPSNTLFTFPVINFHGYLI